MFSSSCLFRCKRITCQFIGPPLWVLFSDIKFIRAWQGESQASGPQVWIYTMLESSVSAASYYYPFALSVSVWVCSIAIDPMGPRGVTPLSYIFKALGPMKKA